MKVQRQFVNKRGDKSYHKYVVVIPPEVIEKSKLKEGDELEAEAEKNKIVLRKK